MSRVAGVPRRVRNHREALLGRRAPELEEAQAPTWLHIAAAAGSPLDLATGLASAIEAARRLAFDDGYTARLDALAAAGKIPAAPTRAQVFFGGLDMLRFLFEPGARVTDARRQISPALHRVLRLVGDPRSWVDPGGLTSELDEVVSHLTEQFHFNPAYDLQLLETFEAGHAALVARCDAILQGSDESAQRARARIPRDDYFEGLRGYARQRVEGAKPKPLHFDQQGTQRDRLPFEGEELARFMAAARQLGDLWGFLTYCARLPPEPTALFRRYFRQTEFPAQANAAQPPSSH